jgi:prostaglandin-H2 D-isomerase / glutathione transferase
MKLRYFPLYGRTEAIRMLLHHSGTTYEDEIIPRPLTAELKAELPNGQVPVLEWEGH